MAADKVYRGIALVDRSLDESLHEAKRHISLAYEELHCDDVRVFNLDNSKSELDIAHGMLNDVLEHMGARKRSRPTVPTGVRIGVMRRDGFRCQFPGCDVEAQVDNVKLQIHHIVPVGVRGSGEMENLITLCPSHHKHCERHPEECPRPVRRAGR